MRAFVFGGEACAVSVPRRCSAPHAAARSRGGTLVAATWQSASTSTTGARPLVAGTENKGGPDRRGVRGPAHDSGRDRRRTPSPHRGERSRRGAQVCVLPLRLHDMCIVSGSAAEASTPPARLTSSRRERRASARTCRRSRVRRCYQRPEPPASGPRFRCTGPLFTLSFAQVHAVLMAASCQRS